jgi:hypothetical protein
MSVTVSLNFSDEAAARLAALLEKTEADDYGEVIKNALRLYEALITLQENGRSFLTRDDAGNVIPLAVFDP